jgi:carboxypeptidase C (cathepsin A)
MGFTGISPGSAQSPEADEKKTEKVRCENEEKKERSSETTHSITVAGKRIEYRAVAGDLIIEQGNNDGRGRIFYVAYETLQKKKEQRPLTFVFNGGPGAASVWLHLGGLGPKRIRLMDAGTASDPPVRYVDNPGTWLVFTDLVFVDPVGTGFSRSDPGEEKSKDLFYGVKEDIESVAEFIRLYLSKTGRWVSPMFLVGESYGTTRAAGLTQYLHQRYGIDLNGVVLVSPILDYDTILFHPSNDLPYALFLPTYAATAWYHGKIPGGLGPEAMRKIVEEAKHYALNEYISLLARGDDLTLEERTGLKERLHMYTGLPVDFIEERHFRIKETDFLRYLLKDRKEVLGRMDTTVTGVLLDPSSPYPGYDPSFDPLFGPFSSAMNAYVRDDLHFESDLFYEFLNMEVNRK